MRVDDGDGDGDDAAAAGTYRLRLRGGVHCSVCCLDLAKGQEMERSRRTSEVQDSKCYCRLRSKKHEKMSSIPRVKITDVKRGR